MARPTAPNLLEQSGLPLAYPIRSDVPGLPEPPSLDGHEMSARTVIRSLTVMQKEAVVSTSSSPVSWRLSSDEGPYLNGHDFAPAPLAVMTAGFAADLMVQLDRALAASGSQSDGIEMSLDTHFTMSGSMLQGTMRAGAAAPVVSVSGSSDPGLLTNAVHTAVNVAATTALMHAPLHGLFSLTSHGRRLATGRVDELEGSAPPQPDTAAGSPPPGPDLAEPLVVKVVDVGDKTPDAGTSLHETQERPLHLRAQGRWRTDGVKEIDVDVKRPFGSTFRVLSEEPSGRGGGGRAPDALSLISAGLGFCFMTQIGRFAKIAKSELGEYSIIQDTRFSAGDPTLALPAGGRAGAPVTHVYLAAESDDFARQALDMSEQTCFLHALCRAELRPKVRVAVR